VPVDPVALDEVPLDAEVVPGEVPPPPRGSGCGLSSALYAVGLESITLILSRVRSLLPYNEVLFLPAVPGMLEHPAIPNKDTLAVIQSNR
jgi:hypothetical protein